MDLKIKLLKQMIRFVIIGTLSAAVNFAVVIAIVEAYGMDPLYANILAFLVAFQVSYFGHRYWTFNETVTLHQVAFPRLFLVAGASLLANEALYSFFLNTFKMPYTLALFLVLSILPLLSFTLNKLWVFR